MAWLKPWHMRIKMDFRANPDGLFWQRNTVPKIPWVLSALRHRDDGVLRWFGTDTEENYRVNGNREFSLESVDYKFNEFGYRSDEFDVSGAAPALMFVGCSLTQGIGIPFDKVWTTLVTRHFEQVWDTPLSQYNMAKGGSGCDDHAMIIHQCVDVLRPRAVFVLWSYINRISWFETIEYQHMFNAKPPPYDNASEEYEAFLRLFTDAHAFMNFVRNYNFVVNKLAGRVPFVCGMVERFELETLEPYMPLANFAGWWDGFSGDLARDNGHSGVKSHAAFAEKVIRFSAGIGLA